MKINYREEVLKLHPKAKCYNTGSILGGLLKVYHVGVREGNIVKILVPADGFSGSKSHAWKVTYEHLTTAKQRT